MKPVILSADNAPRVSLVPEWVAAHLERYARLFCEEWIWQSPEAAPLRKDGVARYDEGDFIRWLSRWVCPEEPPVLLEILPDGGELPARLRDAPSFLF